MMFLIVRLRRILPLTIAPMRNPTARLRQHIDVLRPARHHTPSRRRNRASFRRSSCRRNADASCAIRRSNCRRPPACRRRPPKICWRASARFDTGSGAARPCASHNAAFTRSANVGPPRIPQPPTVIDCIPPAQSPTASIQRDSPTPTLPPTTLHRPTTRSPASTRKQAARHRRTPLRTTSTKPPTPSTSTTRPTTNITLRHQPTTFNADNNHLPPVGAPVA